MKRVSGVIQLSVYISLYIMQPAFAKSWPIFSPPDKQLLLNLNYIETAQCPNGQGKLVTQPPINIHQHLCTNYCPVNWEWAANSDEKCHDLSNFNFKNIEITHYPDENGTNYSVISATYGPKESNAILFEYVMKTEPGERWYCVVINKEIALMSCANDV